MKKITTMFLAVFLISCAGNKVKLPIETSLGSLVRVEKKSSVATDEQTISSEAGQVLYVLSFEGKNEIRYEGGKKDPIQTYALVDSNGKETTPLYAATPIEGDKLSNKDWHYDGQLHGTGGGFSFVGVLRFSQPKVTLVYRLPSDVSGLALKDGERRHSIN